MFTIDGRVVLLFEDVVQFSLNMRFYDVCSLILTKPRTNQIYGSN